MPAGIAGQFSQPEAGQFSQPEAGQAAEGTEPRHHSFQQASMGATLVATQWTAW